MTAVSAYHQATSELLGIARLGMTPAFRNALEVCRRRHAVCERVRAELHDHRSSHAVEVASAGSGTADAALGQPIRGGVAEQLVRSSR
jgi:hypothetical protein